jgi:peptidoglycan hydrolase CwlO-like protein
MHASASEAIPDDAGNSDNPTPSARDRFGAFYVVFIGLFVLLFAYLMTVRFAERMLEEDFQERVDRAIVVTNFDRPVAQQMKHRIDRAVRGSAWVRWGGLRVTILVLAQDGITWLYVDGHGRPDSPEDLAPTDMLAEWMDLLPATAEVTVTLPHNALFSNSILVVYAAILLQFVYLVSRRQTSRESERLNEALRIRDEAAHRTAEIELELEKTRSRLSEVEPIERELGEEIDALQRERQSLHGRLADLAAQEEALRGRAEKAVDLAQEVRALEDLLEEATNDLDSKDGEIGRLEQTLRKAAKTSDKATSARKKATDLLGRRLRTLYKTVEIDDRAISDIASLGDEALRLKAEESVKRLADDADNVSVRRKVGGLPDHVHVYELGFAGKGRIYYMRGKTRRFRILLVGAKNTQDSDLEYLSRLPRSDAN